MKNIFTVMLVLLLLIGCIPSKSLSVDMSVLEEIPPEAAVAWLQKVQRNKIGLNLSFFSVCDFSHGTGAFIQNQIVPWSDLEIEAVQRLEDGGIISLEIVNTGKLSSAFSNKNSCYAYRAYYYPSSKENHTEQIQVEMEKTLTALLSLGVKMNEELPK